MKNRMKYCIANFKMNLGTQSSLTEYFNALKENQFSKNEMIDIIVAPPFTVLNNAVSLSLDVNSNIKIAAQNVNENKSGAYTGEISIDMLKDAKVNHVIVGHSERRAYYNESNEQINNKNKTLLSNGFIPIFCIGETLEQRSENLIEETLREQLSVGLLNLRGTNFIIAYEPVWAIGTGKTVTSKRSPS